MLACLTCHLGHSAATSFFLPTCTKCSRASEVLLSKVKPCLPDFVERNKKSEQKKDREI
jgi:hypothetical protein